MRCAFGGLGLDSLPDRISKPFCTICADGGRRGTMANASPRHTAGFKASAVELHKAAGLDAVHAEIAREPGCGAGSPSHWVKTAGGAFPLRAHRDLLQQASDSLGAGLARPGGARGEARRRRRHRTCQRKRGGFDASTIRSTISLVTKERGSMRSATQSFRNSSARISRCPLNTSQSRFLSIPIRRPSSEVDIP